MQEMVIAKRYAQALALVYKKQFRDDYIHKVHNAYEIFLEISKAFCLEKFIFIVDSKIISKNEKLSFLESLFKDNINNDDANKLLKILVKNDRLSLIPFLVLELKKIVNSQKNVYEGTLYAKQALELDSIKDIESKLSKRLGIRLNVIQEIDNLIEGIRLEVGELGVEVTFLKNKFATELSDSILKAI